MTDLCCLIKVTPMDQYFVVGIEQMYDKTITFRIPVKEVRDSGFKMSRIFRPGTLKVILDNHCHVKIMQLQNF